MTTGTSERCDPLQTQILRVAARLLQWLPAEKFLEHLGDPRLAEMSEPKQAQATIAQLDAEAVEALTQDDNTEHPLVVIVKRFELSQCDLDLLMVAVLPELDDRFGDLFARVTRGQARRPSVGLGIRLFVSPDTSRTLLRTRIAQSRLWSEGLLLAGPETHVPLLDQALIPARVLPPLIEDRLPSAREAGLRIEQIEPPEPGSEVHTELEAYPSLVTAAAEAAGWLVHQPSGVVHAPCDEAETERTFALVLARVSGQAVFFARAETSDLDRAADEAVLVATIRRGVLAFVAGSETEAIRKPRWRSHAPSVLMTPTLTALSLPREVPHRRIRLPKRRPHEQFALWRSLVGDDQSLHINLLASQTHLKASDIRRCVDMARQTAQDQQREIGHDDLVLALAQVVADPVSPMARTTRPHVEWSRLVTGAATREKLAGFVRRLQHRIRVQDEWQMTGSESRGDGLVALLHGESGTGKTLAVEALASQLAMPLIAVDLSRVVSKYIGQTEKNLKDLFELAEGFRGVLFFDEADALFGKRTGIKDSHDRYANIEISFLLQQLEVLDGVAVLATNILQNVDEAFTRRIQFLIHLARPTPGEQLQIWREHLPEELIGDDIELEQVVTRFDLVGGEIRNASLTAAYDAAARNQDKIDLGMLKRAIESEFLKKGRRIRAETTKERRIRAERMNRAERINHGRLHH